MKNEVKVAGDARSLRHLQERLHAVSCTSQRERYMSQAATLVGLRHLSHLGTKFSDIGHGAKAFDIFPAGFWSCFDPIFAHCVPIPLLSEC